MKVLAALTIALSVFAVNRAMAGDFPGKGDRSAWGDALPHYNLGNRYLEKKRYDDAVEEYQKAIDLYDQDADFHLNMGVAYRKSEDFDLAEQCFRRAIAINDKDWMAWSDLANSLLKQNKLKECADTFKQCLKCKPPAAEVAAIQKDIADIQKILDMQTPKPQAKPEAKTLKPQTKLVKTEGKMIKPFKPRQAPQKADESGWDYIK